MKKSKLCNFIYLILFLWIIGYPINTFAVYNPTRDTTYFYEWLEKSLPLVENGRICVYGDSNSKVPEEKDHFYVILRSKDFRRTLSSAVGFTDDKMLYEVDRDSYDPKSLSHAEKARGDFGYIMYRKDYLKIDDELNHKCPEKIFYMCWYANAGKSDSKYDAEYLSCILRYNSISVSGGKKLYERDWLGYCSPSTYQDSKKCIYDKDTPYCCKVPKYNFSGWLVLNKNYNLDPNAYDPKVIAKYINYENQSETIYVKSSGTTEDAIVNFSLFNDDILVDNLDEHKLVLAKRERDNYPKYIVYLDGKYNFVNEKPEEYEKLFVNWAYIPEIKENSYETCKELFGDSLSDKLLTNKISDELLESVQNAIF